MQKIRVIGSFVQINSGLLELTQEQAFDRKHALSPADGESQFKVLKPVCFREGEVFGYEGPELSLTTTVNIAPDEDDEDTPTAKDKALEDIDPDTDVPVQLLKDALEQKTIKDTCTLLNEKYGLKTTKGSDTVTPEVFALIATDYGFEFEEEE